MKVYNAKVPNSMSRCLSRMLNFLTVFKLPCMKSQWRQVRIKTQRNCRQLKPGCSSALCLFLQAKSKADSQSRLCTVTDTRQVLSVKSSEINDVHSYVPYPSVHAVLFQLYSRVVCSVLSNLLRKKDPLFLLSLFTLLPSVKFIGRKRPYASQSTKCELHCLNSTPLPSIQHWNQEVQVRPQDNLCGICGGQRGTGTCCAVSTSRFFHQYHSAKDPYT
jgi:hypothetical protein